MKDPNRYNDLLSLPHHQSHCHPPMSLQARAAQFSPFAALVGYEEQVFEAARLTEKKHTLSDYELQILNHKLRIISEHIHDHPRPIISVTYFQPDARKDGGSYETFSGHVKKFDCEAQTIHFYAQNDIAAGKAIRIGDIFDLSSELFNSMY